MIPFKRQSRQEAQAYYVACQDIARMASPARWQRGSISCIRLEEGVFIWHLLLWPLGQKKVHKNDT
ncbi:MAG: hypothetical protein N3F66_13965 [Spirochaetes bacterium]|nr:hypothetical protein [Spirochaetota bacterium]